MDDPDEKELVEDIDREVAARGGLIALVLCLVAGAALIISGAMVFWPSSA